MLACIAALCTAASTHLRLTSKLHSSSSSLPVYVCVLCQPPMQSATVTRAPFLCIAGVLTIPCRSVCVVGPLYTLPALQMSGPSPEFQMAQSAMAKLSISPALKQQMLDQVSLNELYSQAGTTRRHKLRPQPAPKLEPAVAASQAAAVAAAREQLTYQRLVASKPMQRAVAVVSQQLRNFMGELYKKSSASQQHSFEVALLIDNSGSMARLVDETKQAMVLLAEVLRRLEVKFALVRFGRAHGQVVLKGLNQPFSAQVSGSARCGGMPAMQSCGSHQHSGRCKSGASLKCFMADTLTLITTGVLQPLVGDDCPQVVWC